MATLDHLYRTQEKAELIGGRIVRFMAMGPPQVVPSRSEVRTTTARSPNCRWRTSADYFQAGTEFVWDVDTVAECVHVYRAADPERPTAYHKGEIAEAEPAVPGWRVAVDWIFA